MQTIVEYGLVGLLLLATIGRWLGPKVFARMSKRNLDFPSCEDYHVMELLASKSNPFWFRVFPDRQVLKAGASRIKISKRKTYVLVLIQTNGHYEYTLMVKNREMQIPDDWRAFLTGFNYPEKNFPTEHDLDGLYTGQSRRRRNTPRRGYPQP